MKISYKAFELNINELPPGVSTLHLAELAHVLVVFSGHLAINGRRVTNSFPTLLPRNREYVFQTLCPTIVGVMAIPTIRSFQIGDFRIGV